MTTNFGGVVVVPLQGAIVVCYGWGAEGDDQFWWSGRGAIAGCHCSVLWLREGDDQLWGSGRGAIAGCHCSVLWWGEGRVATNFGGVDVVLLLGAIAGCHCSVPRCGKGEGRPSLGELLPLLCAVVGGEEDDQLWGAGCHCSWGEGRVHPDKLP